VVEVSGVYLQEKVQTDGAVFTVHRQPIALDRFAVHDVRPSGTPGLLLTIIAETNNV